MDNFLEKEIKNKMEKSLAKDI